MRYELSRYTFIYPWKNLFKRIYNSMYCYILFMYTCIPAHRQYLLERAPTKVKVKKLRKINTHVQEEEAAYRNSKKLLVEMQTFQTSKSRVMNAAEDISLVILKNTYPNLLKETHSQDTLKCILCIHGIWIGI